MLTPTLHRGLRGTSPTLTAGVSCSCPPPAPDARRLARCPLADDTRILTLAIAVAARDRPARSPAAPATPRSPSAPARTSGPASGRGPRAPRSSSPAPSVTCVPDRRDRGPCGALPPGHGSRAAWPRSAQPAVPRHQHQPRLHPVWPPGPRGRSDRGRARAGADGDPGGRRFGRLPVADAPRRLHPRRRADDPAARPPDARAALGGPRVLHGGRRPPRPRAVADRRPRRAPRLVKDIRSPGGLGPAGPRRRRRTALVQRRRRHPRPRAVGSRRHRGRHAPGGGRPTRPGELQPPLDDRHVRRGCLVRRRRWRPRPRALVVGGRGAAALGCARTSALQVGRTRRPPPGT